MEIGIMPCEGGVKITYRNQGETDGHEVFGADMEDLLNVLGKVACHIIAKHGALTCHGKILIGYESDDMPEFNRRRCYR
jgi:hypothetical protein